ncbi:hypothetical protein P4S73_21725 [Paraglaciecola sp. Hal342]
MGFDLGLAGLFGVGGCALSIRHSASRSQRGGLLSQPIPAVSFSFRRLFAVSQVSVVGAFFGGLVTGDLWH